MRTAHSTAAAALILAVLSGFDPVAAETQLPAATLAPAETPHGNAGGQIILPAPAPLADAPVAAHGEAAEAEVSESPSQTPANASAQIEADPQTEAAQLPSDPVVDANPVERDRNAGQNAPKAAQLLGLMPLQGDLPMRIGMGASRPEPGILRLTGEVAALDMRLILPQAAAVPKQLLFTRRSSVNVLADAAMMTVRVNGAEPVELPLDALSDFAMVEMATEALVPGENLVQITLRQPHRIFCGPDASFGSWTEFDLSLSGAPLPPDGLAADAEGFALYLQSEIAAGRAISLISDPKLDSRILRAISDQVTEELGGGVQFDRRSFYSLGSPSAAAISIVAADRSHASFRRATSGGVLLHIEVADGEVPSLDGLLPKAATSDALALPLLHPGRVTALSALGMRDTLGNTQYYRHDLAFALPADWMLLGNQKAALELHYGFAQNLAPGALLLVKINDQTVRLLPLDQKGGEILPPLKIVFSANRMHAGRNLLSFEMMVPGNPANEPCSLRRSDMLVLLSSSNIFIPPSPSMSMAGMVPKLRGLTAAGVQNVAGGGAEEQSAMAFAALEIAAGLQPFGQALPEVSLTVGGIGALAQLPLAEAGLTRHRLQDVLFPTEATARDLAALAADPASDAAAKLATPQFQLREPPVGEAPVAAAANDTEPLPSEGLSGFLPAWGLPSFLPQNLSELEALAFMGNNQSLQDWLAGRTGQALLLRPDGEAPDDLWLLLAPDARAEHVGAALNSLRQEASGFGEAALLQADGTWQIWSPIRPPSLLAAPQPGNLRSILGNYASWSPLLFTVLTLAIALLSALPALLYVLLSRSRGGGR